MIEDKNEMLNLLREIRDSLVKISACFEDQYIEIQRERIKAKLQTIMSPARWRILPYLFDPACKTQQEIAVAAAASQPTVSRFVRELLNEKLIDESTDEAGNIIYIDKHNLVSLKPEE